MSNYDTCKDCEYGKPNDSGWKWQCTYNKTLEDPDEVKDCRLFRKKGSGSGGCFLTTACCVYKGLPDDCHELQLLRKFRDEYIKEQPYGEELIGCYYAEGPLIVQAINSANERDAILEDTYQKIVSIVKTIEVGKNEEAVIQYMMLFHRLSKV